MSPLYVNQPVASRATEPKAGTLSGKAERIRDVSRSKRLQASLTPSLMLWATYWWLLFSIDRAAPTSRPPAPGSGCLTCPLQT